MSVAADMDMFAVERRLADDTPLAMLAEKSDLAVAA